MLIVQPVGWAENLPLSLCKSGFQGGKTRVLRSAEPAKGGLGDGP